jgi:hypothetical protein
MRDGCSCCLRALRPRGAREYELLQLRPPPIAALLVLLVYIRGKRGTYLAQMLDRRSLFPQASPINGLC